MQLIGTENGRVVLLFPIEEMRPLRGLALVDTVHLLTERYQFMYPPDLSRWENAQASPLVFRSGKITRDNATLAITQLSIYTDGISVDATITDVADEFIDDLLAWCKEELGMRHIQRPARKIYTSTIIVEFGIDFGNLLSQYERICSLLSASLTQLYGIELNPHVNRLAFGQDPTKVPESMMVSDFVMERRANYPYEAQRFFCVAPLPTNAHIQLLEQLESIIGARS